LEIKKKLKFAFLTGLILIFSSLFLDWYIFQVFNADGTLLDNWAYNIFSEWSTTGNVNNEQLKPSNLFVPVILNFLIIIVTLICAFGVIFRNIESEQELNKLYPFAYANIFLLLLAGFYIFIFPIGYLFTNDLFFPFLMLGDVELNVTYFYCIGPGYVLQILAFVFAFPHTIFYYQTILRFEIKRGSPSIVIEKYIEHVQERLDLDKFIAEEELKKRFKNTTSNIECNQFNEKIIENEC